MTDLNELSEIEKQLKDLIQQRQSQDKIWREGGIVKVDSEHDRIWRDGRVVNVDFKHDNVYDHNESIRKIKEAAEEIKNRLTIERAAEKLFNESETFMAVKEHGRPFDKQSTISRMAVREHGRPFDQSPRRFATKMMGEFHGRPYEKKRSWSSSKSERMVTPNDWSFSKSQTLMAVQEHGRPFSFSSITSWLPSFGLSAKTETPRNQNVEVSTYMAVKEHGQPYARNSLNCAGEEEFQEEYENIELQ